MPFYRMGNGTTICYTNKCAATALIRNMVAWDAAWVGVHYGHFGQREAAHTNSTFYWWAREPHSRLVSGYRFFTTNCPHTFQRLRLSQEATFEEFVIAACSERGQLDKHFRTQTSQLSFKDKFIPTKIMRLDDLTVWWPELYHAPWDGSQPNASTRILTPEDIQLTPKTDALWKRVYHDDIEHYRSAEER